MLLKGFKIEIIPITEYMEKGLYIDVCAHMSTGKHSRHAPAPYPCTETLIKNIQPQGLPRLGREREGKRSKCPVNAGESSVSHLFYHFISTFHSHNLSLQQLLSSF